MSKSPSSSKVFKFKVLILMFNSYFELGVWMDTVKQQEKKASALKHSIRLHQCISFQISKILSKCWYKALAQYENTWKAQDMQQKHQKMI